MGNGNHEAAVHQARPVGRERRVVRAAVGAVAQDVERRAAIALGLVGAPGQRHRHAFAVACWGPDALGAVSGGGVAGHFAHFAQGALAAGQVQVPGGQGLHHRSHGITQMCSVRVGVAGQRNRGGGRSRHRDGARAAHAVSQESHLRVRVNAFLQRNAGLHQHHMLDGGLLAPWHQRAPEPPVVGRALRCRHELEVGRVFVGLDDPAPVQMVGHVAHLGAPRQHHARGGGGRVGVNDARFGGVEAADADLHVLARRCVAKAHKQRLVGLIEDLHIAAGQRAQAVAVNRPALQRDGVLQDVEERAAVVGPGQVFEHAGHRVGQVLPGAQVAKAQRVDAAASGVFGPGQQIAVRADGGGADLEEGLAGGACVLVQQQLFRRLRVGARGAAALTHQERIFRARLVLAPQPPAVVIQRHAAVVFLDARAHLGNELVLQRLQGRQQPCRVGVFSFQVAHDFRPLDRRVVVAQPVVFVDPVALRTAHGVGHLGCDRRQNVLRKRRCSQSHHEQGRPKVHS